MTVSLDGSLFLFFEVKMRRFIIRCADLAACLSLLGDGEEGPERLPLGTLGINVSRGERAEMEVLTSGGGSDDIPLIKAILSRLFAGRLGYPMGVFSMLVLGREEELEITKRDRDECTLPLSECESGITGMQKRDGLTDLMTTDVLSDGRRVRIVMTDSAHDFGRAALTGLSMSGDRFADVSVALSLSEKDVSFRSSVYPIPSYTLGAVFGYLGEVGVKTSTLRDVSTGTPYVLTEGKILLPFWCGEIV